MAQKKWQPVSDYEWQTLAVKRDDDWEGMASHLDGDIVNVLRPIGKVTKEYDPLSKPRLFREFVECEPTPEGFRRFALKYGTLGIAYPPQGARRGEPYDLAGYPSWLSEWTALRTVSKGWDVVRAGTVPKPMIDSGPGSTQAIAALIDDGAERQRPTDRQRDAINTWLADRIQRTTSDALQRYLGAPRVQSVYFGRSRVRFQQNLLPSTLIGVLWLQCLWEITGEQSTTPCANDCGRWISSSRRGSRMRTARSRQRSDARFCSDLCRATWHQTQKRITRDQALSDAERNT